MADSSAPQIPATKSHNAQNTNAVVEALLVNVPYRL